MPKEKQPIEEKITDLEGRFTEIENKSDVSKPTELEKFEDIKFYPRLKVDSLTIKYMASTAATEPTLLSNTIILWKDTTNTKFYLKASFNGTAKKIELI